MYSEIDGSKWWAADQKQLHLEVFAYVEKMDQSQSYKSADNLRHARLYGNYDMDGLDAYSYSRVESAATAGPKVTLNIIQSLVDTVVSKITKSKPRPTFLTEGGNWSLQRKAKKLTKFVDGIFSSTKFFDKATLAFTDSCIFGTGAVKWYKENGQIKCERTFIDELKVDDTEAYYGAPRQMHQVKYIHKDVLKAMFPQHAIMIDQASETDSKFPSPAPHQKRKSMLRTIESWRLPSGPEAKDGKHSIAISSVTLFSEAYEKSYFPFTFFRWNRRPVGFFGQGLAEQLQGIQLEINKILRTIQVSMHLVSVPKLLVEASSKVVTAHLNNKIGGIIKYAGTPPQYAPLGGIPGELFSHLDRLYQRAYEISGVSQLSAQSLKPAGLDSGKALREFNDLETERFLSVAKSYEQTFIDAASIVVDMARDLYKDNAALKVTVKGHKFIETIKWSEVDMEEDKFMMDVFPASALSSTPAGRMQDVQDLMEAGFLDKENAMKLLDFPDLEGAFNMLNADSTNLERIIEQMMDHGEYYPPEPFQNLENLIRKTQQAYLMYKVEGAPEERLELLRQYMTDAQGLLNKAQQVAPSAAQQVEQLAASGAPGAAELIAQQAGLGSEPSNLLVEGAIPLEGELPPEADMLPADAGALPVGV